MFSKVLVANRGEIAVRIIRALEELGIASVAVYSEIDRDALHVARAGEAYLLGGAEPAESYLNVERIIAATRESGAEAIHPGYGFLAENAGFAARCEQEGIVFIGPPAAAIEAMGSKTRSRELMAAAGVPIVPGTTSPVKTVTAARKLIAADIGYPVALKAQAATLAHKSEVGGVLLNIADETALRAAWQRLHDNVARAQPGLVLDGALVEKMGERGLELVVGASRDAQWGPILMVGLGGIWVEALGDVQLLAPDLPRAAIIERLRRLKAAKLLDGFRGAPPIDLDAVADVIALLGQLMLQYPEVTEVDINPLVAYGRGQGVVALDALIVTQ